MPWIDADELLDQLIRENALAALLPVRRPLNYSDAAHLADIAGPYRYEHQSDGTTRILVAEGS